MAPGRAVRGVPGGVAAGDYRFVRVPPRAGSTYRVGKAVGLANPGNPMTRRYDVRTGMVEDDPGAEQSREELVPGWRVPGHSRYDYDIRIGDAERDAAMVQLREHFVAGRLTFDELTERIDAALAAKTRGQIETEKLCGGHREIGKAVGIDGEALEFAYLLFEGPLDRDAGLSLIE